MLNTLLLTGAVLRPRGFELGEGKYYEAAKLLRLELATGEVDELLRFDTPNAHYPAEHPNLQFTAGCFDGDRLWLPTDTELHCYRYPELEREKSFSHPWFHNVHSVTVTSGGQLAVTSTGLDLVGLLDPHDGRCVELLNAEGKPVWHRFSADEDYRVVHSTRPHDCHPNYVFELDGDLWVTRCTQEDAVSLRDTRRRIDVASSKRPISVHDGLVTERHILFTAVDGSIILADRESLNVVEVIDLNANEPQHPVVGWCRGIHLDGDILYLGFSKLRRTRSTSRLRFLRRFTGSAPHDGCTVRAYDLANRRTIRDYRLPAGSLDAIYSILGT